MATTPVPPGTYSVKEALKKLQIGRNTFYAHVANGRIRTEMSEAGRRYVTPEAIAAFLKQSIVSGEFRRRIDPESVIVEARIPGQAEAFVVTLGKANDGLFESDVFRGGEWVDGGTCKDRDAALVAALQALCDHLYLELSETAEGQS